MTNHRQGYGYNCQMSQTADSGDYWREANNLSSVCDRASGTVLGVNIDGTCGKTETSKKVVRER